jgi:WD40 repeat protein
VQLSYLQVYLEKLYRSASEGREGTAAADAPVVFTEELVRRIGALRDVMLEFLEEQTALIQTDLKGRFRKAPDDMVRNVLEEFTTLEGTKIPRTRAQIDAIFDGRKDMLEFCLAALESRRLLRNADGVLELAHDSLAGRIAEQRSGERKNLLNIRRVIADRSAAFAQTHAYLARQELALIALYRPKLTLNDAEVQFLETSARAVRTQQRWVRAGFAAIVLLLAAVGATFFLLWRNTRAMVEANNSASLRKTVLESRAMFDTAVPATLDLALQLSATAFRLRAAGDSYDALHTAMLRAARVEKIWRFSAPVLAINADQSAVVTVTPTGVASLQQMRGGESQAQDLSGQSGAVRAAVFSPDNRSLATAGDAGTIDVWNIAGGLQRGNSLHSAGGPAWSLAFSPDGLKLAAGYEDGHVELWDLVGGNSAASMRGHGLRISGLAFSPDGRTLATGSDDQHVMLWDLSERHARVLPPMQHGGAVSAVAFSPDGHTLVSGGADHCARLWNVDIGQPIGSPLCAHAARIFSVAFSPDGRSLATGSLDGTARLWDVTGGKPIEPALSGHKGLVWSVRFARDGASLFSTSADDTVIRWSVPQPAAPFEIGTSPLRALALSPDGHILAAGGDDRRVRRWTLAAGAAQATVLEPSSAKQADSIAALAIDRTGEELAVSSEDDTFQVLALKTGLPLSEPRRSPGGNIFALAFDPAGTTLAAGSYDGSVVLWGPRAGDALTKLVPAHQGSVLALAYSADGHWVASGGLDHTVHLWRTDGAHSVQAAMEAHQDTVWGVAFHPSGLMLASASDDKTVRFWDLPGGVQHATALMHEAGVRALAFSPNGRLLASGDAQGSIYWWDVQLGRRTFVERGAHQDAVTNLAYLPDGQTLLSTGEDGALRRWDSPDSWIERICSKLNANMSHAQWREWVGELDYVPQCPGLPIQPDEGGS